MNLANTKQTQAHMTGGVLLSHAVIRGK